MTTQRSAAQEQSLQASLFQNQKEREQLQFELQQARSALESHASDREYMQSEASSLQQALQRQTREAEQAQQVHDSWMTRFQAQVRSWHCCSLCSCLQTQHKKGAEAKAPRQHAHAILKMQYEDIAQRYFLYETNCIIIACSSPETHHVPLESL